MEIWNLLTQIAMTKSLKPAIDGFLNLWNDIAYRCEEKPLQRRRILTFNSKNFFIIIRCKKITNKVFISTRWYYSIRWNTCLGGYGFRYNSGCCWKEIVSMKTTGHEKCTVTVGVAALHYHWHYTFPCKKSSF